MPLGNRGEKGKEERKEKTHRAKVESQREESVDRESRVVVGRGQRKWV